MPQPINLFNHIGGNKTALSPFYYDRSDTPESLNTSFEGELGGVTKAEQYEQFLDDLGSAKIQGLFGFERPSGATNLFVATNGAIYESGVSAWTSRETGLDTEDTTFYEGATFYDKLFVTNGVEPLRYTANGTTWETNTQDEDGATVTYRPKLVEVYRDRLYIAHIGGGQENRFRFSDLADGTTWTESNYVDTIDRPITGMRSSLNYLFLTTRESLWRWDESYLLRVDNIGTRAPRSLAAGDGILFFANREGVWITSGTKAKLISRPVQAWIDGIIPSNLTKLNGAYHDGEYYLWIGDSNGQSDVVLAYSTELRNWRVLTNWPSAVMATWTDGINDDRLYIGNNTSDSLVYKVGGVVDQNGTATEATYTYPVLTPVGADREFQGTVLFCYAKSDGLATFQIQYALDWQDDFKTLGEWTLSGEGFTEVQKFDVPVSLNGRAVQWRIVEESEGIPWTWQGLKFYYEILTGDEDA